MGNFSQLFGAANPTQNQMSQAHLQNQIQAQLMQQHQQQFQQQSQQKQMQQHLQQMHQLQLIQQQQQQQQQEHEIMQMAQQKFLQQQQQQHQSKPPANNGNHHQQSTQNPYDATPALKQLRDIADRSNPLFNLQNHGSNQQFLMNEFNKLFQNPELMRKFQQTQNSTNKSPFPQQQQQQQQQQPPPPPVALPPPPPPPPPAPSASIDPLNFEHFLKQANMQNPHQAAQMLSAFLPPQHLKEMGISHEQFLSHMMPHFNQLQQQQQQQQQQQLEKQSVNNNSEHRFNMSPKLNNQHNRLKELIV